MCYFISYCEKECKNLYCRIFCDSEEKSYCNCNSKSNSKFTKSISNNYFIPRYKEFINDSDASTNIATSFSDCKNRNMAGVDFIVNERLAFSRKITIHFSNLFKNQSGFTKWSEKADINDVLSTDSLFLLDLDPEYIRNDSNFRNIFNETINLKTITHSSNSNKQMSQYYQDTSTEKYSTDLFSTYQPHSKKNNCFNLFNPLSITLIIFLIISIFILGFIISKRYLKSKNSRNKNITSVKSEKIKNTTNNSENTAYINCRISYIPDRNYQNDSINVQEESDESIYNNIDVEISSNKSDYDYVDPQENDYVDPQENEYLDVLE